MYPCFVLFSSPYCHNCTLFPYTTLFRSPLLLPAREPGTTGAANATATRCRLHGRQRCARSCTPATRTRDRKSTRLNSSHVAISYAVFCLKKKETNNQEKVISDCLSIR